MRTPFFLLMCLVAVLGPACSCGPTPGTCAPGAVECACREGSQCDEGLICGDAQLCVAPTVATLHVSDANARGCEAVLVEQGGTALSSVGFKNGTEGAFVREAPRVAVSFVAGGDSALSDGAVELRLSGERSGLSVQKASCVDARGQRLSGVQLSIR